MPTNIDSLSIEISSSAKGATKNIDDLVSSLRNLRSALGGDMGAKARKLSSAFNDLGKVKDSGPRKVAEGFDAVGKSADNAKSKVSSLRETLGNSFSNAAKKATGNVKTFVHMLARVAGYRILRTIIKEITSAFKEGITNLYHYSSAINGHFAKAMNSLATSALYLKNSLGTLVAPLIESLAPAIDWLVDQFVALINLFNQFTAAMSGASTYTVAKKYATVWDDESKKATNSVKSSVAEIKRTILGFDELNVLDGNKLPNSIGGSSSNKDKTPEYGMMFEEKPLTGLMKKLSDVTHGWPDWLKWLLGVGGVAAAAWGISKLPALLKTLLNRLKDLIGLNIPQWLKNLFGGKGGTGGDGTGVNFDLPVNLLPGDMQVLDNLKDQTALVKVGLQHWGWDNIEDWIGTVLTVHVGLRKWGWDDLASWIGNYVTVYIGLAHWGWGTIEDWIGSAVTIHIGLRRWGWTSIYAFVGTYVPVRVTLFREGWESLEDWVGTDILVKVGLFHWNWTTISDWVGTAVTVNVGLRRWGWSNISDWVGRYVTVNVSLRKMGGSITVSSGSGRTSSKSLPSASGGGGDTRGGGAGRGRRRLGGVYRALLGAWGGIPQYAGGTADAHGSLFLAGEAGPEVIGHVGGRTEVLNRSQIAATMYASVVSAMSPMVAAITHAVSNNNSGQAIDYTALADAIVSGLRTAGVGAVYLDGAMLSQSINRESRRIGRPAVTI